MDFFFFFSLLVLRVSRELRLNPPTPGSCAHNEFGGWW